MSAFGAKARPAVNTGLAQPFINYNLEHGWDHARTLGARCVAQQSVVGRRQSVARPKPPPTGTVHCWPGAASQFTVMMGDVVKYRIQVGW